MINHISNDFSRKFGREKWLKILSSDWILKGFDTESFSDKKEYFPSKTTHSKNLKNSICSLNFMPTFKLNSGWIHCFSQGVFFYIAQAAFIHFNHMTFLCERFVADVDECSLGTHNCDRNSMCQNTVGSFICTCSSDQVPDGDMCAGDDFFAIRNWSSASTEESEFSLLDENISNRKEKNTGQNRPVVCNYLSQFYGLNFHEERSGALHDSELAYVLEHLQCNENILFCRLSFPLGPRWHGQLTNVSHFSFPCLPIFTSTIF